MIYETKLKLRITFLLILLIIGGIAFSMGVYLKLTHQFDSFAIGYLTGSGGGLIGVSIIMALKNMAALKNREKLKARKIEEQDERNLSIAYKSGYYTMAISILVMYLVSFYLVFNSPVILKIVNNIICFMLISYAVIYFILRKVN